MQLENESIFNNNITFVIFAYNEEKRIDRVVRNLKEFGPILIVDNFSEDSTVQIAKSNGCEILLHKNTGWTEDDYTVGMVKEVVKTDWIYWGFMDEMIDYDTFKEINRNLISDEYDIINITRKNYFYGKFFHDAFADRLNRIFKKDAIDFIDNKIHHFGKPVVSDERILILDKKYFVHHFINNTANTFTITSNRYSELEITVGLPKRGSSFITIFLRAIKRFILNILIKRGYKTGMAGIHFWIISVCYDVLIQMKRFEHERSITRETIENKNDIHRDNILDRRLN